VEDLVPTEFYLSRNFPNPFKERTIIKYCLPEKIKVMLEILDYEKRKIKTLVDEIKEAGTYQVELHAEGLQSNNYYYRMQAGNPSTGSGQVFVETKKMVLIM
jgi:phosphodiesterase/alkaline phosphatase D-like protein